MKEDGIQKARGQLVYHNLALQLIAQMVTTYIAGKGPAMILDEVLPRLDLLENLINSLLNNGQRKDLVALDDHESLILSTNDYITRRAQEMVTEVMSHVDGARCVVGRMKERVACTDLSEINNLRRYRTRP